VASLSQGRTAAAQCGLFTHKSVPVIFEPPCTISMFEITDILFSHMRTTLIYGHNDRNMKTTYKWQLRLHVLGTELDQST